MRHSKACSIHSSSPPSLSLSPSLLNTQDLKNSKASLKKMAKSLEKEREKLSELEAAPGKHQKEIQEMEKKLKILEVSG